MQAGSKAELVMSLALLAGQPPGALLICNGYKDAEYMQLVRISRGHISLAAPSEP
jgi:arginine decarboxylase-like protein